MKRVVLCRPQGPRNVGSVLRLTANFGPCELWLVRPTRPSLLIHPDFEQMSHGVEDVASKVVVVDALEDALADCDGNVGFTVRPRDHRTLDDWRDVSGELAAQCAEPERRIALVFGSEENGLIGEEADGLMRLVRFPISGEHRSINLAMAVGIVLSALYFDDAPSAEYPNVTALPGRDRAFLIERLKDVLGQRTWTEGAKRDLVASIERVFARAPLETRDARAWHMLARSLGSESEPADYGLEGPPAREVED